MHRPIAQGRMRQQFSYVYIIRRGLARAQDERGTVFFGGVADDVVLLEEGLHYGEEVGYGAGREWVKWVLWGEWDELQESGRVGKSREESNE